MQSRQPLKLALSTDSQLPPVAVAALKVNWKSVPVLAMVNVCGSGLAPFTGLVKLIAFTWRKTFAPTTTRHRNGHGFARRAENQFAHECSGD